ncbi:MAG: radical SAM protein, partial [Clostridia bacterium]|nr:radical SAM protein [Clostridia bacterium]
MNNFPTAYIRIADGCNNNCHYCAIPLIRGHLKSRKIEDIVVEARGLVDKGIRELVVIAQDTTSYGIDIYGKPMLFKLIQELSKL